MTRLRKLLEKSEAARHQSEYSLLLEQKKSRELKDEIADRDDKFSEETQKYKGTFLRFSNAILRSKNTLLLTKPVKVFSLTRPIMSNLNKTTRAITRVSKPSKRVGESCCTGRKSSRNGKRKYGGQF